MDDDHRNSLSGLLLRQESEMNDVIYSKNDAQHQQGTNKSDEHATPTDNGGLGWNELKTKAGKDRKRLPLACIACRRKKIRCSGEKPACKHCVKARTPCIYKQAARKFTPRVDYMATLDKRMKRMEERLLKYVTKDQAASLGPIARSIVKPPQTSTTDIAKTSRKRSVDRAFKDEQKVVLTSKDDEASTLTKRAHTDIDLMLEEGKELLPDEDIQHHLVEVFFENCYGQTYLLLHKPSFMRRLKARLIPPVLILAICALAARFSTHPRVRHEPPFLAGEEWGKAAAQLVLKNFDKSNLTNLTVLIILGVHEFGTCNGGKSWTFGGMAMRMAYALQLHKEPDNNPLGITKNKNGTTSQGGGLSFTDREIRRRLMWCCFLMDRFCSSGTNRPLAVQELDIEIQLPVREDMFLNERPGLTELLHGDTRDSVSSNDQESIKDNIGVAAYMIRIISLYGKIMNHIHMGGKEKDSHPMWSSKSIFQDLHNQAQAFTKSLPQSLVYNEQNLNYHAAQKLEGQFFFLHISCQAVSLLLHRFSIPTGPGSRLTEEFPMDFLRSSVQACFKASDNIATMFNDAFERGHKIRAPFMGYVSFSAATVHVVGCFSKNAGIAVNAKKHLAICVTFLTNMARYYGVMWPLWDLLRDQYDSYSKASRLHGVPDLDKSPPSSIPLYGDWFSKFPQGVDATKSPDGSTPLEPMPSPQQTEKNNDDPVMRKAPDFRTPDQFLKRLHEEHKANVEKPSPKSLSRAHHRKPSRVSIPSQAIQYQTSHLRTGSLAEGVLDRKSSNDLSLSPTRKSKSQSFSDDRYIPSSAPMQHMHQPPYPPMQPQIPISSLTTFDNYQNFIPSTMNTPPMGTPPPGAAASQVYIPSPSIHPSHVSSPDRFYPENNVVGGGGGNSVDWQSDLFNTILPPNDPLASNEQQWWLPFNLSPGQGLADMYNFSMAGGGPGGLTGLTNMFDDGTKTMAGVTGKDQSMDPILGFMG